MCLHLSREEMKDDVVQTHKVNTSNNPAAIICFSSDLDECDSSSSGGDAADHLVTQLPDELVRDHEHQQVGAFCSITELRDGNLRGTHTHTEIRELIT